MSVAVPPRPLIRPLELDDLDRLVALDDAHRAALGVVPVVSRASVHFYARSGHSFVAETGAGSSETSLTPGGSGRVAVGFVLAHSSWSGAGAVVRLERLAVTGVPAGGGSRTSSATAAASTAAALTAAVVKSAYDAGVYRLVAAVAEDDELAQVALGTTMFDVVPDITYVRLLGAGALSGPSTVGDRDGRGGEHGG